MEKDYGFLPALFGKDLLFKSQDIELVPELKALLEAVGKGEENPPESPSPKTHRKQTQTTKSPIEEKSEAFSEKGVGLNSESKVMVLTARALSKGAAEFVGKILTAVGLSSEQVSMANQYDTKELSLEQLCAEKGTDFVLIFGLNETHLKLKIDVYPYYMQQAGTRTVIFADHLAAIAKDKNAKRKLWEVLQKTPFFTNK